MKSAAEKVRVVLSVLRVEQSATDGPVGRVCPKDGEAMIVTGRNFPTGTYVLRHCATGGCDEGQAVTVPPSGDLDATFPALQRFTATTGARMYCRDHCTVALFSGSSGELVAVVGEALAEGELTVTPDAGVGDGQTVQVTGSDLMAGYAGPTLLVFPTGGWALTQCDAAVLNDLHLLGFFTHCAVLPPTRAIDIAGSTLHTTFPAASTITKILGGTTDCTTSPGACVIGLMRLEQDASLSHQRWSDDRTGEGRPQRVIGRAWGIAATRCLDIRECGM